ncbi:EGF-like membrane protein [Babesia ovata]|uniref:EGF-like membrane protein n=1 Tax=Babesia ovata TaxID=189622 RepID=A0A2H6KB29_9APIC|nr:EGF-like membrane protein [Babesia ovata]GBE60203.1 EGF-like membrane protein [Babesia ovata]
MQRRRGADLREMVKTAAFIAAVLLACGAKAIDTPCDGSHKCKNGATCIKVEQGHTEQNVCICKPQYTGWDCSVEIDYCKTHCRSYRKSVNCQQALCNQGNCISRTEYPFYSCDCGAFYTGANCEVEYNPCSQPSTNPCDHGVCTFVRGTNQVMCQCSPGWAPNPNQQVMKLSWNGADIFVAPPCSEPIRRGIAGAAPTLTPSKHVLRAKALTFRGKGDVAFCIPAFPWIAAVETGVRRLRFNRIQDGKQHAIVVYSGV